MAEAYAVAKLAARRPDWQLPELHSGLQLAPLDILYDSKDRIKCPDCGRSRAHYCYDCLQPLIAFPRVELPFRVSIVTHHEEKASKNTGVQVAILAAGQVDLHSMTHVPTDVDPSRCAVLFPSDTALEVEQLEPDSIDRLFIIDSRWKKAGELVRTDTFRAMRAVKLSQTRSAFWRFHTRGVAEEGVCTVEALYFFMDAMAKQGKLSDPRFAAPHAFDNLLWYFVYQHQVVQAAAQKRLQQAATAAAPAAQGHGEERDAPARPQQQKGQKQQQKGQKQGQQTKKKDKRKEQPQEALGAAAGAAAHADRCGGPPPPSVAAAAAGGGGGGQRAPVEDGGCRGEVKGAGQQQQQQRGPEHAAEMGGSGSEDGRPGSGPGADGAAAAGLGSGGEGCLAGQRAGNSSSSGGDGNGGAASERAVAPEGAGSRPKAPDTAAEAAAAAAAEAGAGGIAASGASSLTAAGGGRGGGGARGGGDGSGGGGSGGDKEDTGHQAKRART